MSVIRKMAAKWLDRHRRNIASEKAIFRHGEWNIPIQVTRGRRDEELEDSDGGFSERIIYQDFIVAGHELVEERDDGFWTSIVPKPGDKIVIGNEVYELAPRDDLPCVENSDSAGILLRLHTHLIKNESQK